MGGTDDVHAAPLVLPELLRRRAMDDWSAAKSIMEVSDHIPLQPQPHWTAFHFNLNLIGPHSTSTSTSVLGGYIHCCILSTRCCISKYHANTGTCNVDDARTQTEFDLEVEERGELFIVNYKSQSTLWKEGTPLQVRVLCQSRGTIYERGTYRCVCLAFLKFWCVGEQSAVDIPDKLSPPAAAAPPPPTATTATTTTTATGWE